MASKTANSDELDPRDGPTAFYGNHHDVTDRKTGGKRVFSKLEQLLKGHYIKPEQFEAGRRFTHDFLKGDAGRTRSSLDMSVSGGGAGDGDAQRLDAIRRHREAALEIDMANGPSLPGGTSTELLVLCCVHDQAFSMLATKARVTDEVIKSWVSQLLAILASYYVRVDRTAGRSTTAYTEEAALKRLEPELK